MCEVLEQLLDRSFRINRIVIHHHVACVNVVVQFTVGRSANFSAKRIHGGAVE